MIQLEKYTSGRNEKDPTGYSYFMPSFINEQWKWENQSINSLLEKSLKVFQSLPNIPSL